MKLKINIKVEIDVVYLKVRVGVRYWKTATIDGIEDVEGDLIPCREGDDWCPIIEIESGKIINWDQGKTADIHYKVCDDGDYYLLNQDQNVELEKNGYVLDCLSIDDNGYGDYIILKVDENGLIENWNFSQNDIESDFINEY